MLWSTEPIIPKETELFTTSLHGKVFLHENRQVLKEELQVVATNIDTVFICMSLNNDFNLRRLERYLSIAWDSGAIPVIVLTKSDLCQEIDEKLSEIASIAIGVEVLCDNKYF